MVVGDAAQAVAAAIAAAHKVAAETATVAVPMDKAGVMVRDGAATAQVLAADKAVAWMRRPAAEVPAKVALEQVVREQAARMAAAVDAAVDGQLPT